MMKRLQLLAVIFLVTIGLILASPILIVLALFAFVTFIIWCLSGDAVITVTKNIKE